MRKGCFDSHGARIRTAKAQRYEFYQWLTSANRANKYGVWRNGRSQWHDCVARAVHTALPEPDGKYTGHRDAPALVSRTTNVKYDRERDREKV